MLQTYSHNIGEKFVLLSDLPADSKYRIFRSFDGKYFNKLTKVFETIEPTTPEVYEHPVFTHPGSPHLKMSRVNFLPKVPLDLVFEFLDNTGVSILMERHIFGGFFDESKPGVCVIFGRIIDISGRPVPNTKVEVSHNRDAYFTNTYANVGPRTYAATDEAGYFEIPLIKGIQVTINVASIGFATTGYVPDKDAVELSKNCLQRG